MTQEPRPAPDVETERRRRIRVAVAAYAYEIADAPLIDDATFDALARAINPAIATGHQELDQFFRKSFEPATGQWIHDHPDIIGVERAWRRWSQALAAPSASDLDPTSRAILSRIERGDRPVLLTIANAIGARPDKAWIRLLDMAARGLVAADESQPQRWSLMATSKRQIATRPPPHPPMAPATAPSPKAPSPMPPPPAAAKPIQMSLF